MSIKQYTLCYYKICLLKLIVAINSITMGLWINNWMNHTFCDCSNWLLLHICILTISILVGALIRTDLSFVWCFGIRNGVCNYRCISSALFCAAIVSSLVNVNINVYVYRLISPWVQQTLQFTSLVLELSLIRSHLLEGEFSAFSSANVMHSCPFFFVPSGIHHYWVTRGSMEREVYLTLLHMTSSGNRTPDLQILSATPCPLGLRVVLKVKGHQHQWLAGGYDLEIRQF